MEIFEKLRKYENIHILFWLVKDTCWMLELRWIGTIMVIPTLALAIYMVYKTRPLKEFYINLAVLFWICANSFWMITEFFHHPEMRNYAIAPFGAGFLFVVIFYFKTLKKT
ncbi:MAG: hypothetical protein ACK5QC_11095 [Bacteroidota bacterium]|jgi:hypothetical protein